MGTQKALYSLNQANEAQECRALLEEASSRANEKEFLVDQKDVQIIKLEKKLEALQKEKEQQYNTIWMEKKVADEQLSALMNEGKEALEKQNALQCLLEERNKEYEQLQEKVRAMKE